jgi:hypothetical protein
LRRRWWRVRGLGMCVDRLAPSALVYERRWSGQALKRLAPLPTASQAHAPETTHARVCEYWCRLCTSARPCRRARARSHCQARRQHRSPRRQ